MFRLFVDNRGGIVACFEEEVLEIVRLVEHFKICSDLFTTYNNNTMSAGGEIPYEYIPHDAITVY